MKPISQSLIFLLLTVVFHHHETLATGSPKAAPRLGPRLAPRPAHKPAHTAESSNAILAKACSLAHHKGFCVASLTPISKSKNATDLFAVAVAALEMAKSNATSMTTHINTLLDSNTEPFMEECLTDCLESYQDSIDQLENSFEAMEVKGYNDVSTWVTAAMSDTESCEDGFKGQTGVKSPLTAKNEMFSKLCSNILAIMNVLKEKRT